MSFGRVVELTVQEIQDQGVDLSQLRIKFDLLKTSQVEPNEAEITVYNLTKATYDKISKVDNLVILKAGYEDEGGAKTVFIGNITNGQYIREGVETRMVLTCFDGHKDFRTIPVSLSYKKGTAVTTILNDILSRIPIAVARQTIIPPSTYSSGYSFIGRAFDALTEVLNRVGLTYSIQNNEIYILQHSETVDPRATKVTPQSGLIETPVSLTTTNGNNTEPIDKKRFAARTLLNPSLLPNSLVDITSKTANGFFKVQTIRQIGDSWEGDFESRMEVIQL